MRFEKLVLRRYGHFTDFALELGRRNPGDLDLHVIYGPNEAGKSTTLAAISDLLYGIARTTPWNFQHANDLLELEASLQQGDQHLIVKRYKNHWTDASNNRLERFPLDLQGLSRDDYVRRFSFDEKTLQDGGEQILNSDGDVGQALFSASAGLANLKEAMDTAMADSNAFWIPGRTRNLRLPELKRALQENKQRSDAVKLDVRAWKKRCEKLEKATLTRDKYRKDRDELQESLRKLELHKTAGAIALHYSKLSLERQELESLGVIPDNHATSLDLSTAKACRKALEVVREILAKNQLALSSQTEQNTQLADLQKQLTDLTLSAPALLLMQAADRIQLLSDETSADYAWRQQQGEHQQIIAQCDIELSAASERLSLSAATPLEKVLPGDAVLGELKNLLDVEQVLSTRLQHAQEEMDSLLASPAIEQDSDAEDLTVPDTRIASDVLHRLQQEGLSHKLSQAREALLESRCAVLAIANRLGVSQDQISGLELPDSSWLNAQLGELGELRSQDMQLKARILSQQQDIRIQKQKCEALTLAGAIDSEVLAQSRMARDAAWQTLSVALEEEQPHSDLQKNARHFKDQLSQHDDLLAKAGLSSQATAQLKLLQDQVAQQQEMLEQMCQVQAVEMTQKIDSCTDLIRSRVAGFQANDAIDIEALRQRHALALSLKESHIECESRALVVNELQHRCVEQASKLLAVLTRLQNTAQLDALAKLELEDLLVQAQKTLDNVKEQMAQQRELQRARQKHLKESDKRKASLDSAHQALQSWQVKWQSSTTGTLFAELTVAQARDTLTWIATLRPLLARRKEALQSLDSVSLRIATRDTAIDKLLEELQVDSLQDAMSGLQHATRQTQEHKRIQKEILAQEKRLAETKAAHARNLDIIESLHNALLTDSDEALLELLMRTDQHRTADERCRETLLQLQGITDNASLDDVDVAQLSDEFRVHEHTLGQQLQTLKSQLEEVNIAYDEANQAWALANRALEDIDTDSEYARLVQERENLLSETKDLARQTATARCGQLVLKAAMARFRQVHQSVILTEAQQAFHTLTGGHYVQLLPRDDGRGNERLFALDDRGNARSVNELSTGTRYQLYLALRAAAHADYATQRPPMPFVADDIMESFDDERSAAAFTVLGKMAEHGQVLYLTHHQHLLEIARGVLGADRVKVHHFE